MENLMNLSEALPEYAVDLKLNLSAVLENHSLTPAQAWGVALVTALSARHAQAAAVFARETESRAGAAAVEDARAAAAIMGMTNIFYRFRHLVGREEYASKPARLRMNRLTKPRADKLDFELYCLAASAITGCETCVRGHEKHLVDAGFPEDKINEAIRIAATVHGICVTLS